MADGAAREIVGVLPPGFWFMDMAHNLVLPLRFDRAAVRLAGYNFQAIARLRPGVTLQQANGVPRSSCLGRTLGRRVTRPTASGW